MILGIYGASGTGREILELARMLNEKEERWKQIVFIDDGDAVIGTVIHETPVVSFNQFQKLAPKDELEVTIALGEIIYRARKYDAVKFAGLKLATLVHPSVTISKYTTLGEGVTVCENAIVSVDVTLEDNVFIQAHAIIGHDAYIKKHSFICAFSSVSGHCVIGEKTYIALNTTIQQGVTIGNDAIIGMGSVVNKDIPDEVIAIGYPARPVKNNDDHKVFK